MRRLTLNASELQPGMLVMRLGDKEFAIPSRVVHVGWRQDDPVVTLYMDGGEVSLYLDAEIEVQVEHPVQDPVHTEDIDPDDDFDLSDDLTASDGYNDWKNEGGA